MAVIREIGLHFVSATGRLTSARMAIDASVVRAVRAGVAIKPETELSLCLLSFVVIISGLCASPINTNR